MTYWKRPISDPIRGLTLDRLNRQLESFEAGYLADFALTAEAMGQRDDILKNVITKRKKAVTRHGWEILTSDNSPAAREQADALEYFYRHLTCGHALKQDESGGFSLLVYQMMDATAKGYSVHEIIWKPQISVPNHNPTLNHNLNLSPNHHPGSSRREEAHSSFSPVPNNNSSLCNCRLNRLNQPSTFEFSASSAVTNPQSEFRNPQSRYALTAHMKFVPLWYFEATTGKLRFRSSPSAALGDPMNPADWLVTTGDALMIACSRAFLFKNYPLQAWLDYAINYGLPGFHASTPATRGSADWDAMRASLDSFIKDLSVITNTSESLDIIDLKGHGDPPFAVLVERMDRIMALSVRGADLSTLSRDRGYGASLQDQESRALEEDDARAISDHLNSTLDRWVINYLFGENQPQLARIKILVTPRDATAQDLAIDQFLIQHGAKLSIHDALERYGRAPAAPGEPALQLLVGTTSTASQLSPPSEVFAKTAAEGLQISTPSHLYSADHNPNLTLTPPPQPNGGSRGTETQTSISR